ncbi:hypothetical protein K488DRAFT_76244 [Vararia minispora EC-137]|uniref:Uncharacterized protein n=1 Tax=Vararia minispora EC-137 TaxID=1314806 RepID=A0ACB8QW50_9AGAM|nr:hypothetical protein K488DRAFT_76244 [Vararia minispora EC-137]
MSALLRPATCVSYPQWRRYISRTASASPGIPEHNVYLSNSTNPYFNLSFEDWLFKFKPPNKPLLLLYRDDPCVIIGRNQNPWKEVNLSALRETGIPFIRRRSGGGTVFHDIGNTNFSIHLPRTIFDRHATAQVILRAVRSLGIDAHVNDRNDICDSMVTRGVASVRSPVRNLCCFQPDTTHESFVDAVVREFREEYGVNEDIYEVTESEDFLRIPYIYDGMTELPGWDWAFGQTPEFTYTMRHRFSWGDLTVSIRSKHGLILECALETENAVLRERLEALGSSLVGKRYGFVDQHLDGDGPVAEVSAWLAEEMGR